MYTITINHTPFNVVMEDEKAEKLNPRENTMYLGLTEYTPQPTISLRRGMCPANMRSTVIHEVVHAFVYAYGHSIGCEEDMCNFIGAQIDDIMKCAEQILTHFDNNRKEAKRAIAYKPSAFSYDGTHLLYKGVDLSEDATHVESEITPESIRLKVTFEIPRFNL